MPAARTIAAALVLALAPVATAQDEPSQDKPVPAEEEKPAPAPKAEVEPVRGVRYRVWMRTGRSMEGVVRAKSVFETRARDGSYVPADEDEAGAGVRFWFPGAQDGFIFMELRDIQRLEELGELSADEGRSLARARAEAAARAAEERFQIKARRAAAEAAAKAAAEAAEKGEEGADDADGTGEGDEPETGDGPAADGPAADGSEASEEPAEDEDAGRMAALLLKFPPTRWSLDSPKEIERRKVILGLFPSDEEKAFLAVFDEWKVAYAAWAEATEDEAGDEPANDDGERRSSDRR
jgi:hypothetical protein